MKRYIKFAILGITIIIMAGCAAPSRVYQSTAALPPPLEPSVIIMPPDVVVSVFTAGGNAEPRADWTETVSINLEEALQEYLYGKGVEFVHYGDELRDEDMDFIRQTNVLLDAIELSQLKKPLKETGIIR